VSDANDFASTLKREGRFKEFKRRRLELESTGLSKSESYVIATSEFGSASSAASPAVPPSGPEAGGGEPSDVSVDVFKGKSSTLREDYQWVYENIAHPSAGAEDAPSCGAWGLLQFARSDPKSFYVEWMRMVGRQQDEDKVLREYAEDAARSATEIAKMLAKSSLVQPDPEDGFGEPELQEELAGGHG